MEYLNFLLVHGDFARKGQIVFQDAGSSVMESINELNGVVLEYLIVIVCVVSALLLGVWYNSYYYPHFILGSERSLNYVHKVMRTFVASSKFTHHTFIEIVWTVLPAIILVCIAIPSFTLLYGVDEVRHAAFDIRVIGHQWYWSYDIRSSLLFLDKLAGADANIISFYFDKYELYHETSFESFPVGESDLGLGKSALSDFKYGGLRNLDVDVRVVVPVKQHINVVVTASDVLHSWAVPSLGVKVDAIPGRLNQTSMFIKRPGVYYGQCSEICGINHGFMPIVVQALSFENYSRFMKMLHSVDYNNARAVYENRPLF